MGSIPIFFEFLSLFTDINKAIFLSGKCHFFYLEVGLSKIGGIRYFFLDQKGNQKDFLIEKGDHLYFLKETKYFAKPFRFREEIIRRNSGTKTPMGPFKSL